MQDKYPLIKTDIEGEVLARHGLSLEKGQLIKNKNHQRDRSKGIEAFKETVIRQFQDTELASIYINQLSGTLSKVSKRSISHATESNNRLFSRN